MIPYFKFGMAFTVISIIPFNSDLSMLARGVFTVTKNTKFEIKSMTRRFGICMSCFGLQVTLNIIACVLKDVRSMAVM